MSRPAGKTAFAANVTFRTDFSTDFYASPENDSIRARDIQNHGTITTAIAAGTSGGQAAARDTSGYAFRQGVAPGAIVGVSKILNNGLDYCFDGNIARSAGSTQLSSFIDRFQYSLVALGSSTPLPENPPPGIAAVNWKGPGATIINHSWNMQGQSNYDEFSMLLDETARKASKSTFDFGNNTVRSPDVPAFLHVVSTGNWTGGAVTEVFAPGLAKNVLTVGGTYTYNQEPYPPVSDTGRCSSELWCPDLMSTTRNLNTNVVAPFSLHGPPGTYKPELVAPAVRAYGPRSQKLMDYTPPYDREHKPECNALCNKDLTLDGREVWSWGTSFAAPVVSGAAAIVREWHRNLLATFDFGDHCISKYASTADVSPAFLRAALIAGGTALNAEAPDNIQGFGGVSLDRALVFPAAVDGAKTAFFYDQQTVLDGTSLPWQSLDLSVTDALQPIVVALAWTDRAASAGPVAALVNDLQLEIETTDGTTFHHYYGNKYSGRYSIGDLQGNPALYNDVTSTVERVTISPSDIAQGVTSLKVIVRPISLTGDGLDPWGTTAHRQDFAIVAYNAHLRSCLTPPDPPVITQVTPTCEGEGGGTDLTIDGANFATGTPGAAVTVGGSAANVTYASSQRLIVVSPAHYRGAVDVVVTNPDGQWATLPAGHTYRGFVANELWSGPFTGTRGTFFEDLGADGMGDAIVVNDDRVVVRRSLGGSFGSNEYWTAGPYYGTNGTFFSDSTGDHRADAIVVNGTQVVVRPSTGSMFAANQIWTNSFVPSTRGTFFADVTGDAKADVISVSDSGVFVGLSNGSAFEQMRNWTVVPYYGSIGTFFSDVSGDGKADAIVINGNMVVIRRSTGTAFSANEVWSNSFPSASHGVVFVDVNGDGRCDAVAFCDDGVRIQFSTGSAFGAPTRWTDMPYYGTFGSYMADVTGDRRSDAIVINADAIVVRRSADDPCP